MARKSIEDQRQKEFLQQLSYYNYLKPAFVKNEQGFNAVQVGVRLKAMGRMAGFSDLVVFDSRFERMLYFVEMKKWEVSLKTGKVINKGKQSDTQKEFQEMVESLGFSYFLIDSPEAQDNFFKKVLQLK